MEISSPGRQGSRRLWRLKYPRWSQRITSYLQGSLAFVMFTNHFHWAASVRNERIIVPHIRGPWNTTLHKIEHRCEDFHRPNASTYFYYWPEDDPLFKHCCGDSGYYANYTYGIYGARLKYGKYYDLGLIDRCLPYWKCSRLFQKSFEISVYRIDCELTDLQRLYNRRFWRGSVLIHGLLQSALPFILSLEVLVVLFVALYCALSPQQYKQILKGARKAWRQAICKTLLADWTHLCLLAIIGNGLIEAVGHLDPYEPASLSFYNYSQLYAVLSVLVWHSSFLRQLSYWIAVIQDQHHDSLLILPVTAGRISQPDPKSVAPISDPDCATIQKTQQSRNSPAITKLEKKIGLNSEWKWQPIAAQAGILFCLWGFLKNVGDEGGNLLELVVAAAGPWSGLYALKVIVHTFPFLLRRLNNRMQNPSLLRGLWRSILGIMRYYRKPFETPREPPSVPKRPDLARLALPSSGLPSPTGSKLASRPGHSPSMPSTTLHTRSPATQSTLSTR